MDSRSKIFFTLSCGPALPFLCVACRSICDRDQNGIKRSMFVLSRDQDESWATYINQSTHFVRY